MVGMKNANYDALPAKIGKTTDKIRYQLSHINNTPILMKLTQKKFNSIDLPVKIGKIHQQNPVFAITN